MGRDEDDGNRAPRCLQQVLRSKPLSPRKWIVQHQAIGSRLVAGIEKLLGGGEGVDGKARGSQEPAHGAHDVLVVIDHTDLSSATLMAFSRAMAAVGAFAALSAESSIDSARV